MVAFMSESVMKLPRIQNMRSLNRYMMGTGYPANTAGNIPKDAINYSEAVKLKDDWIRWYDDLGWFELRFDDSVYDEARNRLHALDRAAAKSKKELASVINRQKTGMTSEEMEGKPRRALSSGDYHVPFVSPYSAAKYKTVAVVGGTFIGLLAVRGILTSVVAAAVGFGDKGKRAMKELKS